MRRLLAVFTAFSLGIGSLLAEESYHQDDYVFSINYPDEWTLTEHGESDDGGYVFLLNSPGHEVMLSGHVLGPDEEFDLDKEQGEISGFQNDPSVAEIFQRMQTLDLGEQGEVQAAVFRYLVSSGELFEYVFILSDGERLVGFSVMTPGLDDAERLQEALDVIKTFKFQ